MQATRQGRRAWSLGGAILGAAVLALGAAEAAFASDHGDTPVLIEGGRHDARLTDLYAFTRGDALVLALCVDPTIPPSVAKYAFAPDLAINIYLDTNSPVSFDDPVAVAEFGGTVLHPDEIQPDITLRIDIRPDGTSRLRVLRFALAGQTSPQFFAGLRDDPFIRGPRIGRNIAAFVVEMPLSEVVSGQDTILVWATARVPGFAGPFQEHVGRALRSQFPENNAMNTLRPRQHQSVLGVPADVLIFDTSQAASYPNGRGLTDDVVDLVGDPRVLANDFPFPDENDLPFLEDFPYLAAPHPAQP